MIKEEDWGAVKAYNKELNRPLLEQFYFRMYQYDTRLIDLWELIDDKKFKQWYSFEIINGFTSLEEYDTAMKNFQKELLS